MPLFEKIDPSTVPAEVSRPDAAKLVSGDPVHTTWSQHEGDGLYCGTWSSTPGSWKVSYSEWEYFHIRLGYSILTDADGIETHLRPGDAHIIRPGFTGIWRVIETTLKDYVIRV